MGSSSRNDAFAAAQNAAECTRIGFSDQETVVQTEEPGLKLTRIARGIAAGALPLVTPCDGNHGGDPCDDSECWQR